MDIGDIVRRRHGGDGQLGILVSKEPTHNTNPDGADAPRFLCLVNYQHGLDPLHQLHIYYLELVHAVNTPEAQLIHQQYPQHEGHDYDWYLQQRGLVPAFTVPTNYTEWLPGDIVERNADGGTMIGPAGFSVVLGRPGDRFTLRSTPALPGGVYLNTLEGREVASRFSQQYFIWISRPTTQVVENPQAPPVTAERPIQVGDTVMLYGVEGNSATDGLPWNGRICSVTRVSTNGSGRVLQIAATDERGRNISFNPANWRLVQSATAVPVAGLPASDWQVGDILECTATQGTVYHGSIVPGMRVTIEIQRDGGGGVRSAIMPNGQSSGTVLNSNCFRFIERPADFVPPTDYHQWLAGDILELLERQVTYDDFGERSERVGLGFVERGEHVIFRSEDGSDDCPLWVSLMDGTPCTTGFNVDAVRWHSRPSVATTPPISLTMPQVTIPPNQWQVGDIIRRVRATRETDYMSVGEELPITHIQTPDHHVVRFKVGSIGQWWVPKTDLEFVSRPAVVDKPLTLPCRVDLTGTTNEQRLAFEAELKARGFKPYETHSTYEERYQRSNYLVVGYQRTQYLYYNLTSSPIAGKLTDVWNRALLAAELNGKKKAAEVEKPVVITRQLALHQLPTYAVLESESSSPEKAAATFTNLGFSYTPGKYQLLSHDKLSGTDNLGVALAFQKQHSCVWLKASADKQAITDLFRKRDLSLAKFTSDKSSSPMRFALDTTASGTPLITAFKAFMAHIGYRQHNAELNEGPYILLNGGGITSGQELTWQYSPTYNKRRMLFNLSESGSWDKMCQRLSKEGVALPLEQTDELDAKPQAGDSVVITNIALSTDYPENEATLAHHAAGKLYTVTSITNNLALLKETGMLLHTDRLSVVGKPVGISSGDIVVTTTAYGELVKENMPFTYMEQDTKQKYGVLVDSAGNSYAIPPTSYRKATDEELKDYLLTQLKLSLPFTAVITAPNSVAIEPGTEVTFTDCWLISNKRLAFWMDADSDKDAYYELEDFTTLAANATLSDNPVKVYKNSDDVDIAGVTYSRKQLEEVLASAYN